MVWKNVFQLAISGSVWNGINIRITSYKSNIFANIRKNQYGRVTKDGITLNLTDLEYLLGLDFSMIQKNKILNYRSCYKEINILRYTLNDEEMVNITTNTSNKSSCVSIKEDDFFRNCIPFLEYMKQLLEIKLKHLSIDEIFYVVSLVTFEKLKLNYGCYACIGVENEHTCKQSSIYNENSIPYDAFRAIEHMKNSKITTKYDGINLATELNYYNNLLGITIEYPSEFLLNEIFNDILFNVNKNSMIRDGKIYKCLKYFSN